MFIMAYVKYFIFFTLFLLFGLSIDNAIADLISLNKSYTLEPLPNYEKYDVDIIKKALADGEYADENRRSMWTSKQGLTWSNTPRVSITIDLEKNSLINKVAFHTAAGSAGVEFFRSAFVYISRDNINYKYTGVINNEIQPQKYVEQEFSLINLKESARYVRLEFITVLPFFVVDEVSIYGNIIKNEKSYNIIDIKKDTSKRILMESKKYYLKKDNAYLDVLNAPKDIDINQRRLSLLVSDFGENIIFEEVSPWENISPLDSPKKNIVKYDFRLSLPVGGCGYQALRITNGFNKNKKIYIKQKGNSQYFTYDIFDAGVVRDIEGRAFYDILKPISSHFLIKSSESKFILIKMCGNRQGNNNYELSFYDKSKIFTLSGDIFYRKIDGFHEPMQSVTWSYLAENKRLTDTNKKDIVKKILMPLESSMVIPVGWLQSYPQVNEEKMNEYMSLFESSIRDKKISKVIVFLGWREGRTSIESIEWQRDFLRWKDIFFAILKKNGLTEDQIYLYPYDEPYNSEMINEARLFYVWLKKVSPEIKTFVTLNNQSAFDLHNYVDISCVHSDVLPHYKYENRENWLYATKGPAKSNAIYAYYRLLPWIATEMKMSGVGFWSLTDFGANDDSSGNDYYGYGYNYSPIYVNAHHVFSSRRWEAWRLGLQDATLLKAHSKKYGQVATDLLIKQVREKAALGSTLEAEIVMQQVMSSLTDTKAVIGQ